MYESIKKRLLDQYIKTVESEQDIYNNGLISLRNDNLLAVKRKECINNKEINLEDIIVFDSDKDDIECFLDLADDRFKTHIILYNTYDFINGVTQLNQQYCNFFSIVGESIPPISEEHAKYFFGEIQCENPMFDDNNAKNENIAKAIIESFRYRVISHCQAIIVRNCGAITWGSTVEKSVNNALFLEKDAKQAWQIYQHNRGEYRYLPYEVSKSIFFENNKEILFEGNAVQ